MNGRVFLLQSFIHAPLPLYLTPEICLELYDFFPRLLMSVPLTFHVICNLK